jgi:hypothetical protein
MMVHHGAAGNTATTGDAFGRQADVFTFFGIGPNYCGLISKMSGVKEWQRLTVSIKKRIHIHNQILYDGKMIHGPQRDFFSFNISNNSLTGKGFMPVDNHATRSAHAHTAGVTKGNGGVLSFLDLEKYIQDRGLALVLYFQLKAIVMTFIFSGRIIAKYFDISFIGHFYYQ